MKTPQDRNAAIDEFEARSDACTTRFAARTYAYLLGYVRNPRIPKLFPMACATVAYHIPRQPWCKRPETKCES